MRRRAWCGKLTPLQSRAPASDQPQRVHRGACGACNMAEFNASDGNASTAESANGDASSPSKRARDAAVEYQYQSPCASVLDALWPSPRPADDDDGDADAVAAFAEAVAREPCPPKRAQARPSRAQLTASFKRTPPVIQRRKNHRKRSSPPELGPAATRIGISVDSPSEYPRGTPRRGRDPPPTTAPPATFCEPVGSCRDADRGGRAEG